MTAQSTAEPAIRVQGLEKSYKQLQVLRGVDLEVAPGSIVALLGANGAGKTTVVRILATLLKASPAGGRLRRPSSCRQRRHGHRLPASPSAQVES